jgi:hypothetical protein
LEAVAVAGNVKARRKRRATVKNKVERGVWITMSNNPERKN